MSGVSGHDINQVFTLRYGISAAAPHEDGTGGARDSHRLPDPVGLLLAHERRGDYTAATDGTAFAGLLTAQLRDTSHDMHLEVIYSQSRLPDSLSGPNPESLSRYRKTME